MMIPILSARPGWHVEELRRALAERGHESREIRYEDLLAHHGTRRNASIDDPLAGADLILTRLIPDGSLEQIIRRVNLLHEREALGVRIVNSPRAIERTVDKAWMSALLAQAGLPTPETIVCETTENALRAFDEMEDVILKPLFGSMGLGMVRLSDREIAWRVFRAVERIRGVFYLQRTIPQPTADLRALVIGSSVFAAISREGDSWCHSAARGARCQPASLTPEQADLALSAATLVGADYAGVDLLVDASGRTFVLEVNAVPGWSRLQQATGQDVAGAIVDSVIRASSTR